MVEARSVNPGEAINLDYIFVDLLNSLSAIKHLSELDCRVDSEEELLKAALTILIQNQDMDRCSFFLLNQKNKLVNVTGLSYSETQQDLFDNFKPQEFDIGEGIIGLAAEKRALQHCQNCLDDERFVDKKQWAGKKIHGSIISVPVIASDQELLGVLNISHPEPYHFTEWHIRLLEINKNLMGLLISNYRMLHNMEQLLSERTNKLEQAFVEIKELKEHYQNISIKDALTGLYNRRYFYDRVESTLAGFDRYGQSMCLLMLDIDHFKSINDTYGHAFGDEVLVAVSASLKSQVRNTDVLVRFGGEEFVIVFTNTDCQKGLIFSERIRETIAALRWQRNGNVIGVTLSIGLYCLDNKCCPGEQKANIDKIIHFADLALYQAKKRGRNRVVEYFSEMEEM